MVGGKIKDFFVSESDDKNSIVTFLVEDKPYSTIQYCCVMAEIPNDALKYGMIEVGKSIWWHSPHVLIKIEDSNDVQFKKVGFSGGDEKTFYDLKNHKDVQQTA